MTNDLVKRLSWLAFKFCGKGEQENLASDAMSDAIRRIEKLEGELHLCFHRIEELQAALREIAWSRKGGSLRNKLAEKYENIAVATLGEKE
jgi:hypothetical protein